MAVTGAAAVAAAGTALVVPAAARAAYAYDPNDFAVAVVSSTGLPATGLYDDPQAVLGRPTLRFNAGSTASPDYHRAKLNEAPYNVGTAGEKLLTTVAQGSSVTVRMGRPVTNDPRNPFGVDLIVFGNAAYGGTGGGGFTSDATNLNAFTLNGTSFAEPTKVSVSPDGVSWYRYDNGPYADGTYPTNGYVWNTAAATWTDTETDPTLPVDPALASTVAGKSAATVLDTVYAGSAGGTGFDLAESGFASIQFVRIEGLTDFAGGEIDAIADVRPVPEPTAVGLLATAAAAGLLGRRRPTV
ncbi:MAG: hypothetical protein JWO31_3974 [Phycisphaerales bacterium]|nr:hypothetical protein [Phycisphaerales bacterium]